MSRSRQLTDFPRNEQGLVDKFIGTAYDTVKKVHDNLDDIKAVANMIKDLGPEGTIKLKEFLEKELK